MSNRRTILLSVFLVLSVLAVGIYMAPSPKEIALMHMRDANYDEALKFYTDLQARGDNSMNVVAPLIQLHIHYGDVDKAITVLEDFVASHPRSLDARRQLAELYKASQRFNDYCRILEEMRGLDASTENLRKLVDVYDFLGRYADEIPVLTKLIERKSNAPKEDDYSKLAVLDRVAGNPNEAVRVILAGMETRHYKVGLDTAHLATQLLLEAGKDDKALSVASSYLIKSGHEEEAVALSSLFQTYSKLDKAEDLLTPYMANIDHSPRLEQQLVGLWLAQNKEDRVFELLSRQFDRNILPDFLAVTLVDLSIKRKNLELMESVLRAADVKAMPESALLRYAVFAFQTKQVVLVQLIQERLGKEYLQSAPLMAALLELTIRDTPETIATLLALPPNSFEEPDEKLIVSSILMQHGYEKQAYALFKDIPIITAFDILDPYQIALLYLRANEADKGEQAIKAARASATAPVQAAMDKSLLFLAVGEGNANVVRQQLDSRDLNDAELLSDSYNLARLYHHDILAQELVQRLYNLQPTKQNLLELADTLLNSHRYAEAVKYLQKPAEKDIQARQLYLDGIATWVKHAGVGAVPAPTLALFRSAVLSELQQGNLTVDEKRSLAYVLENAGFRDLTEKLLLELAANKSFGSEDVKSLLGFWEDKLSPVALDWVINRARHATGSEKLAWVTYLNDTRHFHEVIALLRDDDHLAPPFAELYIDALIEAHESEQLGHVLEEAINRESNAARLKKLLETVDGGQTLQPVIDKGWRKLYKLDPADRDAAREVGLLELNAKHYEVAEQLLGQNLQENNGDYETNEAYADILQHNGKKSEAEPYLKRALQQVSDSKDKNLNTALEKAHLLYRNHQLGQSLALFRELLARYPQNKALRADFAEILIENRQFDEASSVLAQ